MADFQSWAHLTESFKNSAEALAVFVGGAWAYRRFILKRESETALEIDLSLRCVPFENRVLTYFDVKLANKAVVRLSAKPDRMPAYKDKNEVLKYSGDLLVRDLRYITPNGAPVSWFTDSSPQSPISGDVEADLLFDYEIGGKTDFWMEPGESYHVGTALVLSPGTYLAMVTFVGARRDDEFWRRVFLVQVSEDGAPKAQSAVLSGAPDGAHPKDRQPQTTAQAVHASP